MSNMILSCYSGKFLFRFTPEERIDFSVGIQYTPAPLLLSASYQPALMQHFLGGYLALTSWRECPDE